MTEDIFLKGQRNLQYLLEKNGAEYNEILLRGIGVTHPIIIKIAHVLSPLLKFINVIFALLWVSYMFLYDTLYHFSHKNTRIQIHGDLFLCFNELMIERTKSAGLFNTSINWIVSSEIKVGKALHEKNVINYKSTLTISDFIKCYLRCISTIANYTVHYPCVCLVHKTWKYYLVYYALLQIAPDSKLYFCNQADKWAHLFDNIPSKRKILIQHGIGSEIKKCPCLLNNIDTVYSISDCSWKGLIHCFLSNSPRIIIMNPTIELSDINHDKISVLLVANALFFDIERLIIEYFQTKDVYLYVKRHPHQLDDSCYRKLLEIYKFEFITDKYFPNVDFVVSYESTLAYEYMGYNKEVYIYNSRESFSLNDIINKHNRIKKNRNHG